MQRRAFLSAMVSAALLPEFAMARSPEDHRVALVSKTIREAIDKGVMPGAQVHISRYGTTLLNAGFGFSNIETRTEVTPASVFRVGSLTKQFTAAAILLLAQQGRLKLSDTLDKFVSDFPRAGDVSLRRLLDHTSGIRSYTDQPDVHAYEQPLIRPEDFLEHLRHLSPQYDFDPGTAWHYSNTNYYLLGLVIEAVCKMPFARFFDVQFIRPLGLKDTAVDVETSVVLGRASGYAVRGGTPAIFDNARFTNMMIPGAAGAMRSSARDLSRWEQALQAGKVLGAEALAEMLRPGRLINGQLSNTNAWTLQEVGRPLVRISTSETYGCAMRSDTFNGHRKLGHGGVIYGFGAQAQTYPDDGLTIVILVNAEKGVVALEKRIAEIMLSKAPATLPS